MKKALSIKGAVKVVCHIPRLSICVLATLLLLLSASAAGQDVLVGLTSAGGKLSRGTAFSIKSTGSSFAVNKAFAKLGTTPEGDLIQGSDGNFYGMTARGGNYASFPNGVGTIFKMTPKGVITLLHVFDGTNDGNFPTGNLIKGPDGNFYGMTLNAGKHLGGTVFKITPSGAFTVIYNFIQDGTSGPKSGNPYGSLVLGKDGNFYGMTSRVRAVYSGDSYGVVFKLTPAGVYTQLYVFDYYTGGNPRGNLVQGKDGNFYGMTHYGGGYESPRDAGSVFKITPSGAFTKLVSFDFHNTGGQPYGSLVEGPDGWFYGMTKYGGPGYGNYGTIFKVSPQGQFSLVYNFNANPTVTGGRPHGTLMLNSDGNFYGMTEEAGAYKAGTIFKMTPAGAVTALHQFNPIPDGSSPLGGLIKASDGNFYGMTNKGGSNDSGTIFRMTPTGSYTVLAHLPDDPSGGIPTGSVVQAKDGNFYGFTREGGVYGYGAVFKMCNGTYSVIHSLNGYSEGRFPKGDLVQGLDGNFYGMTYQAGKYGYGTIIKVTPTGTLTVLRNINGTTDGANPWGSLVQGTDGSFYGMTVAGGATGYGTIFKITAAGSFTVIRNLNTSTDGANPFGNLIQAKDGAFYGMTNAGGKYGAGTIFKITATGAFTVLRHFQNSATDGSLPVGSLMQSTDGHLYGMTDYGGTYNYGTIFKITTSGAFTILYNINGTVDGFDPKGSLVRGSDVNFYGLNSSGGTYNGGSIFRVTPTGAFTILRHLNPATDGGTPLGSLVVQKPNPVVSPQTVSTPMNTTKKIILTGSGGTPRTYKVSTAPKNGTATITKDTLFYKPNVGYVGADSLYVTTTWGCQSSAAAKIKIAMTRTTVVSAIEEGTLVNATLAEEKQEAFHVRAMPNPSTTDFALVITSNSTLLLSLRVVDAMGRILESRSNVAADGMLKLGSNYKPGIYYVEVVQGSERTVQKLIKTAR